MVGRAGIYLVIAQTDKEKGHRGINAFIVEKGMPGFDIGPKEDKLGIRGSDTHTLQFNDVKVPKENRIGEDGFGFKFAMKNFIRRTYWDSLSSFGNCSRCL